MKKRDCYLVISFIVIACAMWIGLKLTQKEGDMVLITVDGKPYQKVSIREEQDIPIQTDRGKNIIQIKNGQVKMIEADCQDQICVKHTAIHKTGETIVCLPHKVVVEIIGNQKEIDSVVQ